MRGKRRVRFLFCLRTGITPADAGKTRYQHCNIGNLLGSPPRMRGKLVGYHYTDGVDRITPADAGKTTSMDSTLKSPEDHPRGCGENTQSRKKLNARSGSPPRMRGKPADAATTPAPTRITPADAGKTGGAVSRRRYHQDHPRGCGENLYSEHYSVRLQGSPPRMRGKQGCC